MKCVLGDIYSGHSRTLLFYILQVQIRSWFTSAYRGESLDHTSRILGRYIVLDLVLLNIVLYIIHLDLVFIVICDVK